MSSPARSSRSSHGDRDGYFYNPATGTYIPTNPRRPSHPPPLPPKEPEAGYVTKETHHGFAAELEGDSDIGRLSFDEKSSPSSSRSDRPRKKEKERERDKPKRAAPRQKRKLRILSLGMSPAAPRRAAAAQYRVSA